MDHSGHHGHHGAGHDDAGHPLLTTSTPSLSDGHSDGAHGAASHTMHGGMAMYFHFGYEQFVLLEQWSAQTATSLTLACTFFFILAILYEILKAYRRVVALRCQLGQTTSIVGGQRERAPGTAHRQNRHQSGGAQHNLASGNGNDSAGSSLSAQSSNGHQKLVPSGTTSSTYVMDPSSPTPDDPMVQVIQPNVCHPSYGIQTTTGGAGDRPVTPGLDSGITLFSRPSEMFTVEHFASTLLYMLQVTLAYLLMLAFMLFNVWICLAILVGAAVGHFTLAQKAIALQDSANEDYCH